MEVENIITKNGVYSDLFGDLAGLLNEKPELARLAFDEENSKISDFMTDFIYNVSPWPVIIDDNCIRRFARIVETIPSIINKVIMHYIEHDPAYLCDYLNMSAVALERLRTYQFKPEDIMCRYDAIFSENKIKLVEINIGSSLGGWWSDWLYPEISQALADVEKVRDWNIKYRKITENTFKAVWQSMLRLKGTQAQGNLFIYLPETATANLTEVFKHLNTMVMSLKPSQYPDGQLVIFNDLEQIEWLADGNLRYQGMVMDALLLPVVKGNELPLTFQAKLQAYSEKNKFYYPDSEGLTLCANKLLFALLHEENTFELLTPSERELVAEHIPWSAKLKAGSVLYQGKHADTRDFLIENQQRLVMKKSQSMQGKDVLVGKSESPEAWRAFYRENNSDNDWLIQAYCDPDLVYSADPKVGLSAYRMVWGIFGFDNKYAGSWCRGVSLDNEDTVINLARGAVEFVVTEELAKKRKLVL
ncbi:hypothetical protein SG34_030920 [Thalassomonas viridans]|uniref:Glutathionylspermidine synthase pre-ATP-grasp-like domain-containing protein n=1 Tax=Thalassomonas viridans TaxID=137584 RepID=A0AAF0CFF1_9GAMM|nr:hypothetical protein [Thalassomonas viridans]WDE09179.1 hypothetical protein SG34_030920 [Thalassomonas viridans]